MKVVENHRNSDNFFGQRLASIGLRPNVFSPPGTNRNSSTVDIETLEKRQIPKSTKYRIVNIG